MRPRRLGRYFSRRHLFTLRMLKLYPDALHITSWRFLRRKDEIIPLTTIERADLTPRGSQGTRLVLRMKNGTHRTFGVPHQALWKHDINQLLHVPYHNSSGPSLA